MRLLVPYLSYSDTEEGIEVIAATTAAMELPTEEDLVNELVATADEDGTPEQIVRQLVNEAVTKATQEVEAEALVESVKEGLEQKVRC